MWFSATNLRPGDPEIMEDYSILSLDVKTLPSEEDLALTEVEIIVVTHAKLLGCFAVFCWLLMLGL